MTRLIVLKRGGRIHRLWQEMGRGDTWRDETDLCSLGEVFLRISVIGLVVLLCTAAAVFALVIAPLVKYGVLVYLKWVGAITAAVGLGIFAVRHWPRREDSDMRAVVREWLKAKQGRYCPKVEFRDAGEREE